MIAITIRIPIIASVGKEKPANEVFGDSAVEFNELDDESISG